MWYRSAYGRAGSGWARRSVSDELSAASQRLGTRCERLNVANDGDGRLGLLGWTERHEAHVHEASSSSSSSAAAAASSAAATAATATAAVAATAAAAAATAPASAFAPAPTAHVTSHPLGRICGGCLPERPTRRVRQGGAASAD